MLLQWRDILRTRPRRGRRRSGNLEICKNVSRVKGCGLVGEGREDRAPDSAAEGLIAWLGAVENSVGGVYQEVVMHELCGREWL